ncbi:hypothetical protein [Candidatus Bathycorpusculum sp.]|uniref:hypothetical protein n=1 Tax=Candidatus Bathycorpusculum sp. TaxID=2994959 RepID=UPI00282D8E82|nr:hypothetical protein [Candidatus Termitimicrobium sp.]MCL2430941.1 hypothetical protein [Candidatus Termitimicrobium sp.]
MEEQEQRSSEIMDRITQLKIVKLEAELRINIAGFLGYFIGTLGSIVIVLQIVSINSRVEIINPWILLFFGIAGLLCAYGAYSFREKLKTTRKKINELT